MAHMLRFLAVNVGGWVSPEKQLLDGLCYVSLDQPHLELRDGDLPGPAE